MVRLIRTLMTPADTAPLAGFGPLSTHTIATNATHAGGYVELNVHNMFGLMEERTTHLAVQEILGTRPFLISRSTFPSSGKWTGHWLGDNSAKWYYMYYNIQGVCSLYRAACTRSVDTDD